MTEAQSALTAWASASRRSWEGWTGSPASQDQEGTEKIISRSQSEKMLNGALPNSKYCVIWSDHPRTIQMWYLCTVSELDIYGKTNLSSLHEIVPTMKREFSIKMLWKSNLENIVSQNTLTRRLVWARIWRGAEPVLMIHFQDFSIIRLKLHILSIKQSKVS